VQVGLEGKTKDIAAGYSIGREYWIHRAKRKVDCHRIADGRLKTHN